jgi:isoleucyl-tRNA synthetase
MTASAVSVTPRYRVLATDRSANDLELEVLARWKEEQLFEQTQKEGTGKPPWVFFEGPPTANGRPGIHHVFARTVKDLFCRYRQMKGYFVPRKAGWDTHGLPVEIEIEKQLGISGKQDIEKYGVELFNKLSRESVFKYRGDWQRLSERIAYWLDYNDPYVTYSNEYIESVWWALKTLFEKNRLYRGHKVLPYCPRCGTALSSHEVAQGYEDVVDPSVWVLMDLKDQPYRRSMMVWTTTPWALVSNVALAVNRDIEYVEVRRKSSNENRTVILAHKRAEFSLGQDWESRWEIVSTMRGSDLIGLQYQRCLDWADFSGGVHEVIIGEDFVSEEDGTGVVTIAPAFGADDYAAGQRHKLSFVQPVDARGCFPEDMPLIGGMFVKDADAVIIEELKRRGSLWKTVDFEHAYPHCWRCDTPLLYYARTSWFVRTTEFKDEMIARNDQVNWNPGEIRTGRFGEWLKNNIDWAISRDRYWGTPLPIWVNDEDPNEIEAIGSYAELAEKVGQPLPEDFDPHKPYIDRYTWPAKSGKGTMRRVPEVIDAWFDSGSMPFAQWHYPFENQEKFLRHYPGDFIAEGVDQTRGWFYSLLAIATGLGDALPQNSSGPAPFKAVVVNDLVLAKDGSKMSKSRGNTVEPWQVIETHGVDAIRLFLISSSQVWMPRRFDEDAIRETIGKFLMTLKNVYSGIFALYANFGWEPSDEDPPVSARPLVDQWILSRLATVEREADRRLDQFDATLAARAVMDFFVDDVSNWYVRLNRHRFYEVDGQDNRAAFATLREVLIVTSRLLAPFAPFVTDWIHRELTGESVHLAPYTRESAMEPNPELEEAMSHLRTLATLGRAAREEAGLKVRQPLGRMVCVVPKGESETLHSLLPLLASELNVKNIAFASSADDFVTLEAKANFRVLGKKFGKDTPIAAAAIAALPSEALHRFEHGEPLGVTVGNETHTLEPDDLTIVRRASGELVVKEEDGYFAAIDPTLTPELRREGVARELISRIQRLRKELGFAVSDRIQLAIYGDDEVRDAATALKDWIAGEVLARDVHIAPIATDASKEGHATHRLDLDGLTADVALTRIE